MKNDPLKEAWRDFHYVFGWQNAPQYVSAERFWASALQYLRAYRDERWKRGGNEIEHPDLKLIWTLEALVAELLAGSIPENILPLLSPGAPNLRPTERRARALSQEYVRLASEGLISDATPRKTIAAQFKISESTVRSWLKAPVDGSPWLPWTGLSNKARTTAVVSGLAAAAEAYSRKGRSQQGRFDHGSTKRSRPRRG